MTNRCPLCEPPGDAPDGLVDGHDRACAARAAAPVDPPPPPTRQRPGPTALQIAEAALSGREIRWTA